MKRNYIIPTTESIAFHAGSICSGSGDAGMNVGGNTFSGDVVEVPGGTTIDPM